MEPQTVTATFDDPTHAEDAQSYLLANDFTEDDIIIQFGITNEAILIVKAKSDLEAREAVDALRNYGALDIAIAHSS